MRAARGLLESKLTTPQAISEAPLEDEVEALHSEGNVQRGTSLLTLTVVVKIGVKQQTTVAVPVIICCSICCCLQPQA